MLSVNLMVDCALIGLSIPHFIIVSFYCIEEMKEILVLQVPLLLEMATYKSPAQARLRGFLDVTYPH